jgi:micrococcal nuclease
MHIKVIVLAIAFHCISIHGQTTLSAKEDCKVVGIIDGDTVDCLINFKTIRVRLHAIDAPERNQYYYARSKQALSALCYGKYAVLVKHGHDRYKRLIADVYVNKQHINYKMVELGMAWHFKKYSSDLKLSAIEQTARKNKRGLWAHQFPIAPWDYRALKKKSKPGSVV